MSLKHFLTDFDTILSRNFLHSQSSFRKVIYDRFKSRKLNSSFQIIKGKLDSCNLEFDANMAKDQARVSAGSVSQSYYSEKMHEEFDWIINNHYTAICNYLGTGFIWEQPLFFRNYNYPEMLEGHDIYSNVWHQDSHDGNRLLKIFVNLINVTENDGPFLYLDEIQTKKNWLQLKDRWSFDKLGKNILVNGMGKAVGERGSYMIIDTARCMHRASNPTEYRDMAQITLYPSWRKRESRIEYKQS